MIRIFYLAASMVFLFSCDVSHGPYLKHKVAINKVSENCAAQSQQFSMNSNINGERFVFQECLDADTDESDVLITRSGDTVSIQFQKKGDSQHLYELTVDVNTQPRYNWLKIGNSTIPIIPAGN